LNKVLEGFKAKKGKHLLLVFFGRAEMAGEKGKVFGHGRGGGGLGGRRGLFWRGGCGNRHFFKNKEGQGLGKG